MKHRPEGHRGNLSRTEDHREFDADPNLDLVCHHENVVKDGTFVRVSRNGPLAPNMSERLLFDGNALSPSAVTVKKVKLFEAGLK